MAFFDPKSDVLDIELTQYGKHLLSRGKWNPSYYAFFDDDILYDSQYGGYVESQNLSQVRITGSARERTQYNFSGVETEINKQMIATDRIKKKEKHFADLGRPLGKTMSEQESVGIQATMDRDYALSLPMGRSDIGNENYPAWSVTCLNGTISESVPLSTSSLGVVPIVRLTADDVIYKTEVKNKSEEDAQELSLDETLNQIGESAPEADPSDLILANRIYDDGTYISIEEDYFLMEMLEKNTPFEEENIDIEVFRREYNEVAEKEVLVPLKFLKKKQLVVNDILVDDDDPEMNQYAQLTPSCVEYFFNVWVDDEIDEETLCKAVTVRRTEGLYAPPLRCPDPLPKIPAPNLYGPAPGQGTPDECIPEPACPDEENE
jgi:hypothetical protein